MEFSVLGPLAVHDQRGPVDLGVPKARCVLAALLCRTRRAASTDVLVEALWGDTPPKSAVKNVHGYVHRLRRGLGDPSRIVRHGVGYLLVVRDGECDADRFEGLVAAGAAAADEGRPESAGELFRAALALWRGDAFADVPDVPAVAAEARRLDEVRRRCLRYRVEVDLRLGRHAELVPELVALTDGDPLEERLWELLMTALHRSGRRSDALAAYGRARRLLAEATGLDPGPALRRLHREILSAGRAPARRAAAPRRPREPARRRPRAGNAFSCTAG